MPESLKNDDKCIRSYILNDVLEKVPIDESYENLCKVIGNDAIAFYDFQYWYYRFLGGKQDLDFDRSSEPESFQFSDLPIDAVGLIVDKLEVVERLMLRKVSKPLREFIEKQGIDCTEIAISCSQDLISIRYGNARIIYAKSWDVASFYELFSYLQESLSIYGDHFESEAFNDLAWILKNSKLQIYSFEFSHMLLSRKNGVVSKFFNKFELSLKSLKHQIAVRELDIQPNQPNDILAILPYLKSGYLEKITIDGEGVHVDWKSDENMRKVERIIQLDQWKQAEELSLLDSLRQFPYEVFVQFKTYWVKTWTLNQLELAYIGYKFTASPIFEHCRFDIKYPAEVDDFIDFIGVAGPLTEKYRSVRHLMIPNTDKLLVFKEFTFRDIEIEKKTRDVQ